MNDLNLTIKDNLRHVSIRKKTASRICSTQVLYSFSFSNENINFFMNTYLDNYLSTILRELNLKKIDYELFYTIINGVYDNLIQIDDIISKNLSKKWSIDRLSKTEKSILRLATYELLFEKKFKKLTIINEYISIIDVFCGDANFANGILDNISKELK